MKKSFTLFEVMVSISLFMIIILFLYQTLDMTEKSNKFYSDKLELTKNDNNLKKMIILDIMNRDKAIKPTDILVDKNDNSILHFSTNNIYHNPFYTNITYLISNKDNLIRIESKNKFNIKKIEDDFFDNCYIDILDNNITKFKIKIQKDKSIAFLIEKRNKSRILLNLE
ncbi:MAG: prepilin-type N-terminal cleavage/methylation domain-containing protein [Campylobacterota bacterium]|nr:prepilin-type N-terminal cleavage/methylation domain-containing protein [Campylobacterota bacterium]